MEVLLVVFGDFYKIHGTFRLGGPKWYIYMCTHIYMHIADISIYLYVYHLYICRYTYICLHLYVCIHNTGARLTEKYEMNIRPSPVLCCLFFRNLLIWPDHSLQNTSMFIATLSRLPTQLLQNLLAAALKTSVNISHIWKKLHCNWLPGKYFNFYFT